MTGMHPVSVANLICQTRRIRRKTVSRIVEPPFDYLDPVETWREHSLYLVDNGNRTPRPTDYRPIETLSVQLVRFDGAAACLSRMQLPRVKIQREFAGAHAAGNLGPDRPWKRTQRV